MEKQTNEHPAITFLKSVYQHCERGFINLRFLPKDPTKPTINRFISILEIDSIRQTLKLYQETYNCHFGVATRVEGDGSKMGILQIPALWVDVDMEGFLEEKKNEIRQRYQDFSLKPSFLFNSGGGIHIYWLLKAPASKEEIPQVENFLKRLTFYFSGDMGSTDASRILRIPKTLNYKYTPPREVTIMVFKPEKEYNLSDFDFLPQVEETSNVEKRTRLPEGWEKELLEGVSEGERNNAITRLAGRYIGKGLSREEILPILMDTNSRFNPPLPVKEVEACLDSIINTEKRNHPNKGNDGIENKEKRPGVNLRLTTLDDVFEYEEPQYLIDPILIQGTVNVFGAYTGAGKSIITLSIIKSILTGQLLWEKYKVLKTGPVLLVDEETPSGFLRERVEKMGFDKSLPLYFLHFQDVRLDRDDCFNALMEKIEEVKPVLVVIDSLIRVHRQKEDDATSMAFVVGRSRKIVNSGTTLWTIHHHKKGEGPLSQKLRGSSDIPGGVDIEYALVPKDDYLIFSSVKTRTKPLTPIRIKMDISETEIRLTYAGTEEDEIIDAVIEVLQDGKEVGVKEIWEELKQHDYEIGENRLRKILNDAQKKGIKGRKTRVGRATKWVYQLDGFTSRIPDIYIEKSHEVNGETENSLDGGGKKKEVAHEVNSLDSHGLEVTSWPSKKPIHEVKSELLEGEI